jgi:poly(A) polymerase Pap1
VRWALLAWMSCTFILMPWRIAQLLHEERLFETNEESTLREDVLGQLDRLVQDWVSAVARKKFLPEPVQAAATSKIYTFGSYRLGVHGPGTAGRSTLPARSCSLPNPMV